jgi:hypothetical protein
MADHSKDKCAHPSCNCKATKDSKYCSPYCEAAKDTTEISCNCGHTGCEVSAGAA